MKYHYLLCLLFWHLAVPAFATPVTTPITPAAPVTATAPVRPWPHELSDIAPDPAVRFGHLPNGLRYAILPNEEPPGRLSLRLHVDAGSLHESEEQRGLAHFVEHMVFNGSRNFPNVEELIPQMQRLGIAFGAHANAYTTYDETVYMLDLPSVEDDVLDLAFTVLRDFADGALLEPEEIEKERGVILSELRARDSVARRISERRFKFMLPDFLAAERRPIGLESVIVGAPREALLDFYESYYIPSRMTLIAVGDLPSEEMEALITQFFASMENPEVLPKPLDLGELPEDFGLRVGVFADPELSGDSLTLTRVGPHVPEPDTVATRLDHLPHSVANRALSRRFEILAREEGAPLTGGYSGHSDWLQAVEFTSVGVAPIEGQWQDAVPVLENELRRALEFGFSETELIEVRANWLNALQEAVHRAPTRRSPALANGLVNSINARSVFTHPETNLSIYKEGLEQLSIEDLHQALIEAWNGSDRFLLLTSRTAAESEVEDLTARFLASQETTVEAPEAVLDEAFAYTDFGPPGSIEATNKVEDLDFTQYQLSNHVRVNLKQTDFNRNSISLLVRFGHGQLIQPKTAPGLDLVAGAVMNGGGLGAHSVDELQRILAGRNVGYSFGISENAFTVSGSTTPDDLELQLSLMAAFMTDPGYREEALRQFRNQLPAFESQLKHTLAGASAQMNAWLNGDDPRFAVPDIKQLAAYTEADVRAWLEESLSLEYLELTIVGDFDPKAALPHILKTFGALPERKAKKEEPIDGTHIPAPELPAERVFTYQSKIDNAVAIAVWTASPIEEDVRESRRMHVLSSIFQDRLRQKIREELGATYSPNAGFSASDVFNTAFLSASSTGLAEQTPELLDHMIEVAHALRESGATQDELDRALNPILGQLPLALRENSHWLHTIMGQSQARPYRIQWARERDTDYASIHLEEINALARKYLRSDSKARIHLIPEEAP